MSTAFQKLHLEAKRVILDAESYARAAQRGDVDFPNFVNILQRLVAKATLLQANIPKDTVLPIFVHDAGKDGPNRFTAWSSLVKNHGLGATQQAAIDRHLSLVKSSCIDLGVLLQQQEIILCDEEGTPLKE